MGCGARSIQNQQKLGERGRKMTPVSSHACFEVKRRYRYGFSRLPARRSSLA